MSFVAIPLRTVTSTIAPTITSFFSKIFGPASRAAIPSTRAAPIVLPKVGTGTKALIGTGIVGGTAATGLLTLTPQAGGLIDTVDNITSTIKPIFEGVGSITKTVGGSPILTGSSILIIGAIALIVLIGRK